jgi:hypothetical protein
MSRSIPMSWAAGAASRIRRAWPPRPTVASTTIPPRSRAGARSSATSAARTGSWSSLFPPCLLPPPTCSLSSEHVSGLGDRCSEEQLPSQTPSRVASRCAQSRPRLPAERPGRDRDHPEESPDGRSRQRQHDDGLTQLPRHVAREPRLGPVPSYRHRSTSFQSCASFRWLPSFASLWS